MTAREPGEEGRAVPAERGQYGTLGRSLPRGVCTQNTRNPLTAMLSPLHRRDCRCTALVEEDVWKEGHEDGQGCGIFSGVASVVGAAFAAGTMG